MAISDKYLPGNLNQAEMDTVKGIPMSIFNNLSSEEQSQILGGKLNRTEKDQLRGSEPGTGMSSEFRELIDRLIAMGVPREEVLKIIQSRMDAMTDVGGKLAAGVPMSRFNQGGIVSLRHLTRPIGI